MAKNDRIYERLTRPVAGLTAYSSLWLGSDHLLLVKATGYTETYQRFNYADVQAILARDSDRRLAWNVVWIVCAVILAFPLTLGLIEHHRPIVSGILMAISSALLAVNHFRGPSCSLYLITRVQTVKLPVVRRRKAEQVLERLQPLVTAAQADLITGVDVLPTAPPFVT